MRCCPRQKPRIWHCSKVQNPHQLGHRGILEGCRSLSGSCPKARTCCCPSWTISVCVFWKLRDNLNSIRFNKWPELILLSVNNIISGPNVFMNNFQWKYAKISISYPARNISFGFHLSLSVLQLFPDLCGACFTRIHLNAVKQKFFFA